MLKCTLFGDVRTVFKAQKMPSQEISKKNGTTDPEIDFVIWTKFGDNMAPLA